MDNGHEKRPSHLPDAACASDKVNNCNAVKLIRLLRGLLAV
jgi:hypothetical protein